MLAGLSTKYRYIAVKPHAPDVVDQADLRVFDLDIAGLFSKLQNDGANLGPAGCPDRVALGQQATIDIHRHAAFLIGLFGSD